ncbi:MAG: hypothetical protein V3U03_04555 [Myxococcota bacterium]
MANRLGDSTPRRAFQTLPQEIWTKCLGLSLVRGTGEGERR